MAKKRSSAQDKRIHDSAMRRNLSNAPSPSKIPTGHVNRESNKPINRTSPNNINRLPAKKNVQPPPMPGRGRTPQSSRNMQTDQRVQTTAYQKTGKQPFDKKNIPPKNSVQNPYADKYEHAKTSTKNAKKIKKKKQPKVHKPRIAKKPRYTPEQIQKRRMKRRKILRVSSLLVLAVGTLSALIFGFIYFFRIETVTVVGSKRYSDEEIVEASGIKKGSNIFFDLDSESVARKIVEKQPYISSVNIRRKIPQGVEIQVRESDAAYYMEICREYFILSDNLQVLERMEVSNEAQIRLYGLKKISCKKVDSAFVGQPISFLDSSYRDYFLDVLQVLKQSEMYGKITSITATSKFQMKIMYDDRFEISLGDSSDLNIKLLFSSEIIKTFNEEQKGSLDVRDPSKGYVEIQNVV